MSLKDRVCIVTGGNSGIGRVVAMRFARDETEVAIIGRSQDTLRKTAGNLAETVYLMASLPQA